MMQAHAVTAQDMTGHWVQDAWLAEKKGCKTITDEESSFVKLAYSKPGVVDETAFVCKKCNTDFKKSSCLSHFEKVHGMPKDIVKTWLVCKDHWVISKHKDAAVPDRKLFLTRALVASETKHNTGEDHDLMEDNAGSNDKTKDGGAHEQDYDEYESQDEQSKVAVGPNQVQFPVQQEADGTLWRLMWVQVDTTLRPQHPVQVKEKLGVTTPKQKYIAPTPKIAPKPAPQLDASIVSVEQQLQQQHQQQQQHQGQLSTSANAVSPLGMLGSIFQYIEGQKQTSKWLQTLPKVSIKQKYVDMPAPLAKGEGVNRATWPKELQLDFVALPSFNAYLAEHKNKKGYNAEKAITGVGRALGFIDIMPDESKPQVQASDVEVLLALYTSGNHLQLVKLPLLSPKFQWSHEVLTGLTLYCQFHTRELTKLMVTQKLDNFQEYQAVLENLQTDISGGYQKRCLEHRAEAHRLKQDADLASIKKINIKELQSAVLEGYTCLKAIQEKYNDSPLPKNVRGLANAIIAGGIAFDTFPGRKKEWELLTFDYVAEVIEAQSDFVVCSKHKTAKVYGSIAKLLTPGLFDAFACYAKLHRPAWCTTFLVPAIDNAATTSLPSALRGFCSQFLGDQAKVWPTFNLIRKLFHRQLMLLTSDQDKLKGLMVILDAHSKKVQDSHYILKDHEDDIKLAKELVKVVLGKTVRWPEGNTSIGEQHNIVADMAKQIDLGSATNEMGAEGDEDEDLDYFEGAEMFGVLQMQPADFPVPLTDFSQGAIVAASESNVVAEHALGHESKSKDKKKKKNKMKKDKKHKHSKKYKKACKSEMKEQPSSADDVTSHKRSTSIAGGASHLSSTKGIKRTKFIIGNQKAWALKQTQKAETSESNVVAEHALGHESKSKDKKKKKNKMKKDKKHKHSKKYKKACKSEMKEQPSSADDVTSHKRSTSIAGGASHLSSTKGIKRTKFIIGNQKAWALKQTQKAETLSGSCAKGSITAKEEDDSQGHKPEIEPQAPQASDVPAIENAPGPNEAASSSGKENNALADAQKKPKLTFKHKEWIISKQKTWSKHSAAPNLILRMWINEGVEAGVLEVGTTIEQMRHVCRHWITNKTI